jgi:signal transduction histidine kinase
LLVARTAAHEINNALSPVAGYAELLTLHPAVQDDPVLGSYARLISDAAHEAAAKVLQLQSMVRLQETTALSGPDTPLLDLAASSAV